MKDLAALEPAILRGGVLSEEGRILTLVPELGRAAQPAVSHELPAAGVKAATLAEQHAAELAEVFSEARGRGYLEGRQAAEQECAAALRRAEGEVQARSERHQHELQATAARLAMLIQALESERQELAREMEAAALELALATLRKIFGTAAAGSFTPELVRTALEEVDKNRPLRIRLSPPDHASLLALGAAGADLGGHAEFIADSTLGPGDCLIENSRGSLDASLEAQLRGLKELLVATYQRRQDTHD